MITRPDSDTTTSAGTTADDDSAFDAAFAEFAGEGEGASTPDPPDAEGESVPSAAAQENKSWGNQEQKSIDTSASAALPSGPTNVAPAARPAEDEAARARIAELKHQRRSDQGRLLALQRRLQEYPSKAATAPPGAAHETQGRQTSGTDDARAPAQDGTAPDPLAALSEAFPEVGRPVAKLVDDLRQQNAMLVNRLSEQDMREVEVLLDRNETALAETHPDWQQAVTHPAFTQWLGAQPAYVQQAAQRNGERIVDPAEAGDIIGRFKAAFAASQPTQATQTPTPTGAHQTAATGVPATLAARRQRQLDAGASVRSRAPGPAAGPPDDYDAAFAYYAGRK